MSNTTFDHADGWTGFRDEETGLEVTLFYDGEIIVERFLPDEPEKSVSVYIRPSLEEWKKIRDMADKNIHYMEK